MFTLQSNAQHAIAFDTTQVTSASNYSNPRPGDPCHPLASAAHPPAVAFQCHGTNVGPMGTLRKGNGDVQSGVPFTTNGAAVRRLTPRECERLQGFPDDYTLIPWRGGMAPDGPRYRALGNSMAVPVMAWIGTRIARSAVVERAAA